jgi:hypothetical protein
MFGRTVLQAEKAAKKWLFQLGAQSHIGRPLSPAKHTAQSDDQHLVKIVQSGTPGARILKTLPARTKLLQFSCVSREDTNYLLEETSAIGPSNGNSIDGSNQFQKPLS